MGSMVKMGPHDMIETKESEIKVSIKKAKVAVKQSSKIPVRKKVSVTVSSFPTTEVDTTETQTYVAQAEIKLSCKGDTSLKTDNETKQKKKRKGYHRPYVRKHSCEHISSLK